MVMESEPGGEVVKMYCQRCGKEVEKPSTFRTPENLRIFMKTGICQPCQDRERLQKYFKKPPEELQPAQFQGKKFPLGQLVMTRGVNDVVAEDIGFAKFALDSLRRHANGDWGDMCDEDKRANEDALKAGDRLFSAYNLPEQLKAMVGHDKIWIITEADRSATTTLFPEEY